MKDSDIQGLIEKLKDDKIGYVIDALKELYDAAVMGEDISAAVDSLKKRLDDPLHAFAEKKPEKHQPISDLKIIMSPFYSSPFYSYHYKFSPKKPDLKSIIKDKMSAASVLTVHYVNTGNSEQIIELLKYKRRPSFGAIGVPSDTARVLKDYGFDKIPEEKRMEIKIRALATLNGDEDIEEILNMGEKAIPIVIDIANSEKTPAKTAFDIFAPPNLKSKAHVIIMRAAKKGIPLSAEGMKFLREAVEKSMDNHNFIENSITASAELLVSSYLEKDDIGAVIEMLEHEPKPISHGFVNAAVDSCWLARGRMLQLVGEYLEKKGLSYTIESFAYPHIKITAIDVLNKFMEKGTDVSSAVPDLINSLDDKSMDLKKKILETLGKTGDERAIATLITALKDENHNMRTWAADALGTIGFDKISLEDKVLALLILNKNAEIFEMGEPAFKFLIDSLKKDDDFPVKYNAVSVLSGFGDARAVPALLDVLKNEDWFNVQSHIVKSLENIAEKTAEKEDYVSTLKILKESTAAIMEFYSGKKDRDSLKKRAELLRSFVELTDKIHHRMNLDKKEFPVKHQPVKRTHVRKVIANG